MTLVGHGIDLVETARMDQLIDRHGDHFLSRVFTEAERAYCDGSAKRRSEHYAARFAAKEAVLKAIGTGWRSGIAWTDVEVMRAPSGEPSIKCCGKVAEIAESKGVTGWSISISHTDAHAVASVIAVGDSA